MEDFHAKSHGGPLVAVYVHGPTIEVADQLIPGGEHTPTQAYGRGKGQGEGSGRKQSRWGYAKGGVAERGATAMTQGPITRRSRTEGAASSHGSSDEWGFVNGE